MIVSLNWLKQFTEINGSVDELATLIGARLVEIEEVIDLGKKYEDVIVAKTVSVEKHPDADKLKVVQIDDGGKVKNVKRLENGLVQVVCGAPNVKENMLVAWLPPGAAVPETFDSEPFVLEARKLRGVVSNGMLASAKELDFGDDHTGIVEVDKEAKPGDSFAEIYELNDYLLDIENKSLTHRPDCFGVIGFAREVAAIQGSNFETPKWLMQLEPKLAEKAGKDEMKISAKVENADICERYQVVVLSEVNAKLHSPLQIQSYLARIGMKPISAAVDTTNYLMALTGQPLHAFDYDKFVAVSSTKKADVVVREAKKGEKLKLLDGREIELADSDIIICAGETPVALAGAMGGASTEVDKNTKNILLESATFNLYKLRTTQMRHAIYSEAITRFTKGQAAAQTAPVLASAVRMLCDITGAKRVSDVVDVYKKTAIQKPIVISISKIEKTLGVDLELDEIAEPLEATEFMLNVVNEDIEIAPPYWRGDIHISEDVIEETGRIRGFDSISPTLPRRGFEAVRPSKFDEFRSKLRQILVRSGANEVLTYSFVHGNILEKAGQDPKNSYKITNSISPDLQYYRQSLTPSLLNIVHPNIKNGFSDFTLFEMNKAHNKVHGLNSEGVPGEINMLAAVVTSKKPKSGAPYYQARKLLEYIGNSLGLKLEYKPIEKDPKYPVTEPFDHRRSALVHDQSSGEFVGMIGEYKQSVIKNFKLPEYSAGLELDPEGLLKAVNKHADSYKPLSRYPGTWQDICFQLMPAQTYGHVTSEVEKVLKNEKLEWSISPTDIYQPENGAYKNITIRIHLTSHAKTITTEEANEVIARVVASVTKTLHAKVV